MSDAMLTGRKTIFALASGGLPAGVAIIRVSGPDVRFVLQTMTGRVPEARVATLVSIRSRNGQAIDKGLVLYFPAPNSFTGEACAEFHLHGGRAVVASAIGALEEFSSLRHAEPGEFTRRAFENGQMDLTEVEGLADLISAQTEVQRQLALQLVQGGLARRYGGWANRLTHARAMLEAEFDFSDEDDVPGSVSDEVWHDLSDLAGELRSHLVDAESGERIRDGFRVVIVGAPNVGKSSLLNYLAKRDVAIVSQEAGTTRDVLSVDMDIGGYPVTIVDTAGMRETENAIEQEGIRRAEAQMESADLVLHLVEQHAQNYPLSASDVVTVVTKADLGDRGSWAEGLHISAQSGEGMDDLLTLIRERASASMRLSGMAAPNRQRHRAHLRHCLTCLEAAIRDRSKPNELRAEDLRLAADELGRLTGRVDVENLLDVIFSEFCIGK
nr:tRNA uridine-5-carboxymethylaminomethyl(34) synthesis GTPase MnmE [Pararhizobium haloflavum]